MATVEALQQREIGGSAGLRGDQTQQERLQRLATRGGPVGQCLADVIRDLSRNGSTTAWQGSCTTTARCWWPPAYSTQTTRPVIYSTPGPPGHNSMHQGSALLAALAGVGANVVAVPASILWRLVDGRGGIWIEPGTRARNVLDAMREAEERRIRVGELPPVGLLASARR